MTTWARRGTRTTGEKLYPAREIGSRIAPRGARCDRRDPPKTTGASHPRCLSRVGARRTAGGRVRRAPGPRPSRANRAPAEATTARMLFVNFCRKWYGQAGDRKAHLSACSASLALYTRSARERPVRSSVKLFILRSRRTAGAHEAGTSALFDLTTLQVGESAQLSKSGCQSVVFRFERDQKLDLRARTRGSASKSTNF